MYESSSSVGVISLVLSCTGSVCRKILSVAMPGNCKTRQFVGYVMTSVSFEEIMFLKTNVINRQLCKFKRFTNCL